MALAMSFQPMRVLVQGHDAEGRLILADGQLTAVIVRLDGPIHGPGHKGQWHLEAGLADATCASYPCSEHRKKPEPGSSES